MKQTHSIISEKTRVKKCLLFLKNTFKALILFIYMSSCGKETNSNMRLDRKIFNVYKKDLEKEIDLFYFGNKDFIETKLNESEKKENIINILDFQNNIIGDSKKLIKEASKEDYQFIEYIDKKYKPKVATKNCLDKMHYNQQCEEFIDKEVKKIFKINEYIKDFIIDYSEQLSMKYSNFNIHNFPSMHSTLYNNEIGYSKYIDLININQKKKYVFELSQGHLKKILDTVIFDEFNFLFNKQIDHEVIQAFHMFAVNFDIKILSDFYNLCLKIKEKDNNFSNQNIKILSFTNEHKNIISSIQYHMNKFLPKNIHHKILKDKPLNDNEIMFFCITTQYLYKQAKYYKNNKNTKLDFANLNTFTKLFIDKKILKNYSNGTKALNKFTNKYKSYISLFDKKLDYIIYNKHFNIKTEYDKYITLTPLRKKYNDFRFKTKHNNDNNIINCFLESYKFYASKDMQDYQKLYQERNIHNGYADNFFDYLKKLNNQERQQLFKSLKNKELEKLEIAKKNYWKKRKKEAKNNTSSKPIIIKNNSNSFQNDLQTENDEINYDLEEINEDLEINDSPLIEYDLEIDKNLVANNNLPTNDDSKMNDDNDDDNDSLLTTKKTKDSLKIKSGSLLKYPKGSILYEKLNENLKKYTLKFLEGNRITLSSVSNFLKKLIASEGFKEMIKGNKDKYKEIEYYLNASEFLKKHIVHKKKGKHRSKNQKLDNERINRVYKNLAKMGLLPTSLNK